MEIKRDTMIADIIEQCPQAMPAFMAIGMHCMGCALASGETVEQACYVHEVDPDCSLKSSRSIWPPCEIKKPVM